MGAMNPCQPFLMKWQIQILKFVRNNCFKKREIGRFTLQTVTEL